MNNINENESLCEVYYTLEPNRSIKKESFSCDSILKTSSYLSSIEQSIDCCNDFSVCNESTQLAEEIDEATNQQSNMHMKATHSASLLSVTSCGMSIFGSSSSSCYEHNINTANVSTVMSNNPMISLSKSETNISETNNLDDINKMQNFNVVSLNDLYGSDLCLQRQTTNLSKNACLTQKLEHSLTKLTKPKVLTTITVSMKNTADVSDKIF